MATRNLPWGSAGHSSPENVQVISQRISAMGSSVPRQELHAGSGCGGIGRMSRIQSLLTRIARWLVLKTDGAAPGTHAGRRASGWDS